MKKWTLSKGDKSRAAELAKKLGISPFAAAMLLIKGFESADELRSYISAKPDFADPFSIKNMDKAVQRIERAIDDEEKVCIYGDYDADGVTSTAVMYLYLKSLWCDVSYYIPARESEGYGLNNGAVDKLHEQGVTLIITVDNGISAYEQVKYAASLGIDTVVTDHHEPPERLPEAVAVVDPHRKDDESAFKHFSGVGVAFKLIMALERTNLDLEELLDRFSDICAIGTVADVVSLSGENRTLVREGLKRINENKNIGITALKRLSGCGERRLTSGDIGFILAPRINAGGRLDLSQKSVELLTTYDEGRAEELAEELCRNNDERKRIEREICDAAVKALDENESIRSRKVIVVAGEGWHQGVIGLAAARIKEIYGKPTIVISVDGDKAKGSARSVEGFSMIAGVTHCAELLSIFGGHPMAAGMSLPAENIDDLREKINEYADALSDEFLPTIEIAARLRPGALGTADVESLSLLEPYGAGNPKPVFAFGGVTLSDVVPLKDGMYVKVLFRRDGASGSAVSFSTSYDAFPYKKGDRVDLAVDVKINEYNGIKSVSPQIREIKFTDDDNEALLRSKRVYEEYITGAKLDLKQKNELAVSRDDFAAVYRFLRSSGGFKYPAEILLHRIERKTLTLGGLLLCIKAMEQLGLVTCAHGGEALIISVCENPQKVDIMSAPILEGLK